MLLGKWIALVLLLLASGAGAQDLRWDTTTLTSHSPGSYFTVRLLDREDDGDIDLLYEKSTQNGNISFMCRWGMNNNTETSTSKTFGFGADLPIAHFVGTSLNSLSATDIDGDGILDAVGRLGLGIGWHLSGNGFTGFVHKDYLLPDSIVAHKLDQQGQFALYGISNGRILVRFAEDRRVEEDDSIYLSPIDVSEGMGAIANAEKIWAVDLWGDNLVATSDSNLWYSSGMIRGSIDFPEFPIWKSVSLPSSAESVTSADLDGDGRKDLVVCIQGWDDGQVLWYPAREDGNLGNPITILSSLSLPSGVACGDFDGNDQVDVAVSCRGNRTIYYSLNSGGGIFTSAKTLTTEFQEPRVIGALDKNDDGLDDILVSSNENGGPQQKLSILYPDDEVFVPPDPTGHFYSPARTGMNSMAYSPSGKLGKLIKDSYYSDPGAFDNKSRLLFIETDANGQELPAEVLVDYPEGSADLFESCALFYENDGTAVVVYVRYGDLRTLVRTSNGWRELAIPDNPIGLDWIGKSYSFTQTPDRMIHCALLGSRLPGYVPTLFYGTISPRSSLSHWEQAAGPFDHFNTIPAFSPAEFDDILDPRSLDIGIDGNGHAHICFSVDQYTQPISGGTEERSSLFYINNQSGNWTAPETIVSPGAGFGDGGFGASLEIAPDSTLAVAASFLPRVRTGSPGQGELRYLVRGLNGQWSTTVITNSSDNYRAGDGERGTGLNPALVFDELSRPHIVFNDHASQHFSGSGAYSFSGQVRYATRSSSTTGAWVISTPLKKGITATIDFQNYRASVANRFGQTAVSSVTHLYDNATNSNSSHYFFKTIGELTLTPIKIFEQWASGVAGLNGHNALPNAIPFQDGVSNLLKYAFNMDLSRPDVSGMTEGGSGGLPRAGVVEEGEETYLRVEYVRRKDSGLIYIPQKSPDLTPSSFEPMTGRTTVESIDTEWERVCVDEPCDPAVDLRCFTRVGVVLPGDPVTD